MEKKKKLVSKFRELILYVAKKSQGDLKFGATKLNKLLFYSDFYAYGKLGSSISGKEYINETNGPIPKSFVPERESMIKDMDAAMQTRDYFGHSQERLIPLRDPDMSRFSGKEVEIIDYIIDYCSSYNATDISLQSHKFIGYDAELKGETIPYETVFVSTRDLTSEEKAYGLKLDATVGGQHA